MNQIVTFQITGLNCPSCAVSLDLDLEDLTGVIKTHTNFAAQQLTLEFDSRKITPENIITAIKTAGYTATIINK
jgi:copper chaperone CopZ